MNTIHGLLLFSILLSGGCATVKAPLAPSKVNVRADLVIMDGRTGEPMTWSAAMDRLQMADIVVIGEQHDDATGHAVQLAVTENLLSNGRGALALEMLERDEQHLIEDYRDGIIDAETFATLTHSTDWSGGGSWAAWYQPCIDAAIDRGSVVIAANAPRRYVKQARKVGWESLAKLDMDRRKLVSHPDHPIDGQYRDRFFELMGGHDESNEADQEVVESFYRAQQVWDATMARSSIDALGAHGPPVILLVGRFHSDWSGGTVNQIQRRAPSARVLTISLEPQCGGLETSKSNPQADLIICTGPLR